MKCLILAAGKGTRISRYLGGSPKCTVDVGGDRLIAYTVRNLLECGVRDVALVVGYEQEAIRDALDGLSVEYYVNPFFDVTNSMASAWFARDFLAGDDMLIMNGDVYLEKELLCAMLAEMKSPVMFADDSRREEADYKFGFQNGLLEKYGKELTGCDISGEYIGAAIIRRDDLPGFVSRVMRNISRQAHDLWWENALYETIPESPVHISLTNGRFWAEVDYVEDYERILAHRGYRLSGKSMAVVRADV